MIRFGSHSQPVPLALQWLQSLLSCSVFLASSFVLLSACDFGESERTEFTSPQLPSLTVADEVRGAFLGVWGEPRSDGKVWFVGGERDESGQDHSLIAVYEPERGIRLERDQSGGILWWIWGNGEDGGLWAAGEEGTILRRDEGEVSWAKELIDLNDELLEKLVIWGLWGTMRADGQTEAWAVGGSVRRGGPKGVLLKRGLDGVWRRISADLLPAESSDDPVAGLNLYKIWGDGDHAWIVGEGSLTLSASIIKEANGSLSLSDWSQVELEDERPELLFTVTGQGGVNRLKSEGAEIDLLWMVGGYAKGRAWGWDQGRWSELSLPPISPLNGVASSSDLVLAVGAQGGLLAWHPELIAPQKAQIHQQWVRGAESMTLHSAWASPKGEFWIVGGDLTTLRSGVIITPSDWSQDIDPIKREEW